MTSLRPRRRRVALAAVGLLFAMIVATAPTTAGATGSASSSTYIVLYKSNSSTSDAANAVQAAGGELVANYSQIGVVVARSSAADFDTRISRSSKVVGAHATGGLGTEVVDDGADAPTAEITEAAWGDSLSSLQWDMVQIHVPEAHAIEDGKPSVIVGDLDTGLDFTHPDIAPNYDASRSTDCSSGTPQPLLPGNDKNGHGTHTAGTIAAAANGTGIVGVAPGVKIAGIKSSNDDGFFFPEMVVCSFMWAATHGIHVTNNSYFADPWLYNCRNDAEQRVIWEAERRAIRFAQQNGVLVVASQGNDSTDLSHPRIDTISPDFPPDSAVRREITNACAVVPVEVPGVVGVTATGNLQLKSFYSSYGISTADVAAPGGDSILQLTPAAPNGRVLSPHPTVSSCLPTRTLVDPATGAKYCWSQGTSMAGPHAVGVAALILSADGPMSQGALAAKLQQATNPLPCPDESLYADFPQMDDSPQTCQGGTGHNSFYGAGEVDALKAVQ